VSFLLRVVLPDRPGMLGAVATAIGRAGGDIVSLDVVERGPGGAVDDLLVVVAPGGLADTLISSAQSVEGVVVESIRPHYGVTDLRGDLELVESLAAAPDQALVLLAERAPAVFRAGWAVLLEGAGCVIAASGSAPDLAGGCCSAGRAVRASASPRCCDSRTWQALPRPSADEAAG
jgi:hypothetical protein